MAIPALRRCPRCGSLNVKIVNYQGIPILVCQACGYDESATYDEFPVTRSSQKAKGSFSPYKAGGGRRTRK
ncbi:hypothetical protein HYV81_04825 [Candidatus Woesearchaeota archaeon]|nr:hypothetical protein [Candidatus Woesearchaeota archaeon]